MPTRQCQMFLAVGIFVAVYSADVSGARRQDLHWASVQIVLISCPPANTISGNNSIGMASRVPKRVLQIRKEPKAMVTPSPDKSYKPWVIFIISNVA